MTALSRRDFGRLLAAGLPAAAFAGTFRAAAAGRVVIGVSTDSFRELPRITGQDNVDAVIRALQASHVTHIELGLFSVQPAPPSTAPFIGGSAAYPQRVVLTPEQIAATNVEARYALRQWRLRTPVDAIAAVGRKLTAAGLTVHACATRFDDSFTDEEIDATLRQVRALGAATVTSPLTLPMARRMVAALGAHQIALAIHNDVDGNRAGLIATAQIEQALALSPQFALALDIGNLTASNCDAVAELRRYQPRVSHLLIKDRLRNAGTSQPFGEGDTPIQEVMDVAARADRAMPAFVEYDYAGLRPAIDEVAACVAYLNKI